MTKTKIDWCDYVPHTRSPVLIGTGYIWVWCPEHPDANKGKRGKRGYIAEHRLVMSNHLKRRLTPDEHIHHINGNKSDNRIENLILMSNSEHRIEHAKHFTEEEKAAHAKGLIKYNQSRRLERIMIACACGCGEQIETPDIKGRIRKYKRGHNTLGTHWKWSKNNNE